MKEITVIHTGKEKVKQPLFIEDNTLCMENPKHYTHTHTIIRAKKWIQQATGDNIKYTKINYISVYQQWAIRI